MKNIYLSLFFIPILFSLCCSQTENQGNLMLSENLPVQNDTLPGWIVTISAWGDEGENKMNAYQTIADKWKINIEFSSRLGTLYSYKSAPSVVKEIMDHNDKIFVSYEKRFGKNWRQQFDKEVTEILETE